MLNEIIQMPIQECVYKRCQVCPFIEWIYIKIIRDKNNEWIGNTLPIPIPITIIVNNDSYTYCTSHK